MGFYAVYFGLPMLFHSRVRSRQTDRRTDTSAHLIIPLPTWAGHNKGQKQICTTFHDGDFTIYAVLTKRENRLKIENNSVTQ